MVATGAERRTSERHGERQRRTQAPHVGMSRACQRKSRAVIDTGSKNGQAQGHVHRIPESNMLDDRQALVVIHGDHDVRAGEYLRRECRVCG